MHPVSGAVITRYAFFEGSILRGQTAAFREAVLRELVPTWQAFPGVIAIRVSFPQTRDEGAPEIALILAVDYPDCKVLERALASDARRVSRAATDRLLHRFFLGRIHHHVTELVTFAAMQ